MKAHYFLIACALFVAGISAAVPGALAQDIVTTAGTPFSVHVDAGLFPGPSVASATFSIPALGLTGTDQLTLAVTGHAAFTHSFTISQPGTYPLYTTVTVNGNVVYQVRNDVQALPGPGSTTVTTANTVPPASNAPATNPSITIPAIPDLTPGTTFVMTVTVRGSGTFDLEIPEFALGTYEAPSQVTVQGMTTVPVLIHVDPHAAPGYYTVPVYVADQTASARVHVIVYHEAIIPWQTVVIAGIILIVLGLIIIFALRGDGGRPGARPPNRPRDNSQLGTRTEKNPEGELITYY